MRWEVSAILWKTQLAPKECRELAAERRSCSSTQLSEEGIAIFTQERRQIYANAHFLQYLNIIVDKPTLSPNIFSTISLFLVRFLDTYPNTDNTFSTRIEQSGRQFQVQVIVFDDRSFEIYISDITKMEKTRLLKQGNDQHCANCVRR